MCSPTLDLGKREGQLPLLQVPTAGSAWQLRWVLGQAKSAEHEQQCISKRRTLLHISGEKLVSPLV